MVFVSFTTDPSGSDSRDADSVDLNPLLRALWVHSRMGLDSEEAKGKGKAKKGMEKERKSERNRKKEEIRKEQEKGTFLSAFPSHPIQLSFLAGLVVGFRI